MSLDLVLQFSKCVARFVRRDLPWMCVTASLAVPAIIVIFAIPLTAKVLHVWFW
jgi:hypothetical protein